MAHVVIGLFSDSNSAGKAVAELKEKGYTKDISVVSKDPSTNKIDTESVKEDGTGGAKTGAGVGAVMGGAATLLAGITAVAVPGIGLVAGAVVTALAAATTGAVAGGLVGWLVDKGIPDDKAKEYQQYINEGNVLVAVEAPHEKEAEIQAIMDAYDVDAGTTQHQA